MSAADLPPVVFDDDNPEWTDADFARARPANEVLPPEVLAAFVRSSPADRSPRDRGGLTVAARRQGGGAHYLALAA